VRTELSGPSRAASEDMVTFSPCSGLGPLRPLAGQPLDAGRTATVDCRLHEREDRTLYSGGDQNPPPAPGPVRPPGRAPLPRHPFPALLEDAAGRQPAAHTRRKA